MANEAALAALYQKRAEIVREIEAAEAKLYALDAAIRLFPIPDEFPVNLAPPPRPALRRGLGKPILDALRTAKEPMTARDLTLALIRSHGLDTASRQLVSFTARRVAACLRHYERRGLVMSGKGSGPFLLWRITG